MTQATRTIFELISKSKDGVDLAPEEIAALFRVPLFSDEASLIQVASRKKSQRLNGGFSEVHAQVGVNVSPCPRNCQFCAFAQENHVFAESVELAPEEVVKRACQFEADGANAIFLMVTADYSFSRFVEVAQTVRKSLSGKTTLIANLGDLNLPQAKALKDSGFSGIYHAVRLGEGKDTKISVETRLQTFAVAREVGLHLGTCVEPVGPEHTVEELVEKTLITRQAKPVYSGAARRIPIPGTKLARLGIVSEARMAHILAVVRLALGPDIPGNCTHEPNTLGAAAGANLFWAEVGSNPRDPSQNTENARGLNVSQCQKIFEEAEWKTLKGPSTLYQKLDHGE